MYDLMFPEGKRDRLPFLPISMPVTSPRQVVKAWDHWHFLILLENYIRPSGICGYFDKENLGQLIPVDL